MDKTRRLQIAKTLRTAAGKLSAVKALPGDKWDEDGIRDAIKEITTAAMGRDDTAQSFKLQTHDFWLLDDAVLGAANVKKAKKHPSDDKALLKRIEKEVKSALAAAPVEASTVSAKFTVLLLGDKAGTAETLAEVPGPDAKRAVQQALKLVVDPQFDLSLPENKPKVKVEQRQAPEGPVDVAWVSFDQYTNLLILPSGSAKNWKQVAIRQGGQSLGAKAKVKAASTVKVEKKGQLKDGIWEGESISFSLSLSELLDDLGLKYAAKWVQDGSVEISDAPSARELTDYGKKTSSEAITCFPDAARHAYMTAMESGTEAYLARHYSESVIDLLNEVNGTADYEGEDSNGEPAIVKQNYSVTAEETGDVDGIYSNPYIQITIDEPLHLNNMLADMRISSPQSVDEPFGAVSMEGDLTSYLQDEFSREVKNIEEPNTDHADMDKDVFDEFFVQNVLEMDPGEIAEAIQTYADDSGESVEDVVDTMMKDIPGLDKMSGAIASALEGGYDARQQKLPLEGAAKALAAAEAAIKAAGEPKPPKFKVGDRVFSYQNRDAPAKINSVRLSDDPKYQHAYRLSLPDGNSNWISENSLSKRAGDVEANVLKAAAFTKVVDGWTVKVDISTVPSKGIAKVTATRGKQVITGDVFVSGPDTLDITGVEWDYDNVPSAMDKMAIKVTDQALSVLPLRASTASSNPVANIREKRAAAAKRGDSKAVSYWNEKLRSALSKGPAPSSSTKSKALSGAARKLTPNQQKKLNDKRIEQAYYKVAEGVQIDMMAIPKVFKVGEKAIAEGADDAALEKAISDFVETIREN